MDARLSRRPLLLAALTLSLLPGVAWASSKHPPRILFVCQFGTVKSPVARELLKRRAAERGISVEVAARGITPQQHITPELRERLAHDGINPAAEPLRKLRAIDIARADEVIAFDQLPTEYHPRRFEDWSDLPSLLNDYQHARPILDVRIKQLLDSLSRR